MQQKLIIKSKNKSNPLMQLPTEKHLQIASFLFSIVFLCLSIKCVPNSENITELKASVSSSLELDNTFVNTQDTLKYNQYSNGNKDGLWRKFYKSGQLKSEGKYEMNLKEGLHREWGENGILLLEGFYEEGQAQGLMKWFHEGGHLAGEGQMIAGIRIGPWKICDIQENGFCIDAFFKDGRRDGIWKIYHADARDKLWKEQAFENDRFVSEKCWNKKGEEIECL